MNEPKRKWILARLDDPKVTGGKVGYVETPGEVSGICAGTNTPVNYKKPNFYPVSSVALNFDAARKAGWFVQKIMPKAQVVTRVAKEETIDKPIIKVDKPEVCPKCGGKRRGRGYTHTVDCTENKKIKGV